MEGLLVPLISGITEHESLITSTHIQLILRLMDSGSDVSILSVNVDDDIAFVGIETNIVAGETNFLADSSGNLLEVDLGLVDADFSEKNDLKH